jgi:protein-tyrosine phosphatase
MDLAHSTASGLLDMHFHILPGVDDGPETLADSLALAAAALRDGTRTVVATPHVRHDFVTDVLGLPDRLRELHAALAAEGIPLAVRCGGELGHDMVWRLSPQELAVIAQGPRHARWLLVETPFEPLGADFRAATDGLRDRGFGVVLAHPERSVDAALDGAAGLRRELAAGASAQINAMSILGGHGPEAEAAAFELIGGGLAAVVASDAHGSTRRPALSAAAARLIDQGVSEWVARELVAVGPRRLLSRGVGASLPLPA